MSDVSASHGVNFSLESYVSRHHQNEMNHTHKFMYLSQTLCEEEKNKNC